MSSSSDASSSDRPRDHLVLVSHGFLSTVEDVDAIIVALREEHPHLVVRESHANAGILSSAFTTTLGVDLGGRKLADEVRGHLERDPALTRVSLIGHSLGGLYCRSAAAHLLLHSAGPPRRPPPRLVNYVSYATPHAGSRNHLLVPGIESLLGWGVMGRTGKDIMLGDDGSEALGLEAAAGSGGGVEGGGDPLPFLAHMARPTGPYHAALASFSRRIAVAVSEGDDKVPYHSASLSESLETLPALVRATAAAATAAAAEGATGGGGQGPAGRRRAVWCHFDRDVHGSDGVLAAGGDGSPVSLPAADAPVPLSPYPHVSRVFSHAGLLPAGLPGGTTPAGTMAGGGGGGGLEALERQLYSGSFDDIGGGAAGQGTAPSSTATKPPLVAPLERAIMACLSTLPWILVDTRFDEPLGLLLNHWRVCSARPFLTRGVGADVPRLVAKLFEP
jgi:hypothetical protein